MKKIAFIIGLITLFAMLSACNNSNNTSNDNASSDFNVQIFRVNIQKNIEPYGTAITSRFILERCYESWYPNAYYPGENIDYYAVLFREGIEKYTDEFFAENFLMVIEVTEGSGSIRHEVERVDEDDIVINRLLPGQDIQMTTDMAEWLIVIELSRSFIEPALKREPWNIIFQDKIIS